jgi:hypothetical protein
MFEGENIFIVWAYAGVAIVTLGLVGWVIVQSLQVKARLAALGAQGVRRRSATGEPRGPAA